MSTDYTTLNTLAATLWGEARGEGLTGLLAVACVISNRANKPGWWGTDIRSVCTKPWQFSCWNPNDPNRPHLESLVREPPVRGQNPVWDKCIMAAQAVFLEGLPDITNGANHYCTKAVANRTAWAKGQKPVAILGNHQFYRL
ncbi:MAG TPA: cell wall hydrolase [Roseomonas sp.]|nr:cell wall hydrolase [Roseomonas sp.]